MDGRRRDVDGRTEVVVEDDARQRFYDSRGYGRPLAGGDLALSPVEAAHLLYRGDLDDVDGQSFREFFASAAPGFAPRFLVYADLRERGFYLSPAREGWVAPSNAAPDVDFVVYPRGKGPWDDVVAYRVRAVGERASVPAASLGEAVLAVVDEESELTYLETAAPDLPRAERYDPPGGVAASLFDDRAVVWDPPADIHRRGFYGQPLGDREGSVVSGLQLSLVEAAYLAAEDVLTVTTEGASDTTAGGSDAGLPALVARGRDVEGERFDRRLRAYRDLRERGLVPKTGFKFGADFRVYDPIDSVDDLGHAPYLVRVLPPDHRFSPRDLALDVRLAHGVRKRMLFARQGEGRDVDWLSVSRLTP